MKYHSTRANIKVDFTKSITTGLAENGGLYVPEHFPDLSYLKDNLVTDYQTFAKEFLKPFLAGSSLENKSSEIIKEALNFPLIYKNLNNNLSVLELFHGPTLSFKDFGARFLAQSLNALNKKHFILVATSGDTGSAVASSFSALENVNVVVLYPKGKISPRQEAQITCWSKNILAIAVDGVFDDCQLLVKQAFNDHWFINNLSLSTANSINIGRLLPQMSYYAYSAIKHYQKYQTNLNFVIPGGNLGNATACVYAKQLKLPIGNITIATNENKALVNYLESGKYQPNKTIQTLANAMDVGSPSNFERLKYLFDDFEKFKKNISAVSVSDQQIKQAILSGFNNFNYIMCPHTATAFYVAKLNNHTAQCVVATAEPSKFETIIEPIIKQVLPTPARLRALIERRQQNKNISPQLSELKLAIEATFFN